jgi:hypothetical protein
MELDLDDPPEEADDVPEGDLEVDARAVLQPNSSNKAIDARRLIERRLELRRLQRHLADFDESFFDLDPLLGEDLNA